MSAGADAPQTVVRPLASSDHAGWARLWSAYQRFYDFGIPPETTALTWQRLLDPAEPVHGALARDPASGAARPGAFHRAPLDLGR